MDYFTAIIAHPFGTQYVYRKPGREKNMHTNAVKINFLICFFQSNAQSFNLEFISICSHLKFASLLAQHELIGQRSCIYHL